MAHTRLIILLNSAILVAAFLAIATSRGALNIPANNYTQVEYKPQETSYYCGPAVVQMALWYINAETPSQSLLASEMQTDPVEGVTYTSKIAMPFKNRGLPDAREKISELDDLKENNYDDYLSIILIYFSVTHTYQHYILMIGYNATGIFIHDPWSLSSSQPAGRTTGADAFISNELLADLWTCEPSHWALIIHYLKSAETTLL